MWSRSTACSTCSSARSIRATGSRSGSTRWTPASRRSAGRLRTAPRSTWDRATAPTEPLQYGLAQHPSKIVFVQSNVPGTGYIAAGPAALAKAASVPITELTENVPISDASSVALNLVDDAGSNGWVVLNFTPPEALVILQAAQKLGVEDRVKGWGCSTPCNTDFLAKALGPKWNKQAVRERRADHPRRSQRSPDAALQGDPRQVRLRGGGRHRLVQPDGLPAGEVLRRCGAEGQTSVHNGQTSTRRSRGSRT